MTPDAARATLDAVAAAGDWPVAIAEAALALAVLDRAVAGAPVADLVAERERLDEMVAAVAEAEARGSGLAEALAVGICGRLGFRGDTETYDDPANADLIAVLARRRGLPVSLGILYIHTARARGHRAGGLNVPAHFLIGVEALGRRWALDPFHGGDVLDPQAVRALLRRVAPGAEDQPESLAPVSDRAVLLRLQNNIKLRRLQAGDAAGGLAVLTRMRRMAPESPELLREEAGLLAAGGALRAAAATVRSWLDAGHGDTATRRVLESELATIGSRLN
jgi:regulator of sirC expression with transglutaminase-like and TPR domain